MAYEREMSTLPTLFRSIGLLYLLLSFIDKHSSVSKYLERLLLRNSVYVDNYMWSTLQRRDRQSALCYFEKGTINSDELYIFSLQIKIFGGP